MLTKQEIRQLKEKELQEELGKASSDLLRTRMDIQSGYSKDSHKLTGLRKYVALLHTVLSEQKTQGVKEAKAESKSKKSL